MSPSQAALVFSSFPDKYRDKLMDDWSKAVQAKPENVATNEQMHEIKEGIFKEVLRPKLDPSKKLEGADALAYIQYSMRLDYDVEKWKSDHKGNPPTFSEYATIVRSQASTMAIEDGTRKLLIQTKNPRGSWIPWDEIQEDEREDIEGQLASALRAGPSRLKADPNDPKFRHYVEMLYMQLVVRKDMPAYNSIIEEAVKDYSDARESDPFVNPSTREAILKYRPFVH
jgi:hypothetical protein